MGLSAPFYPTEGTPRSHDDYAECPRCGQAWPERQWDDALVALCSLGYATVEPRKLPDGGHAYYCFNNIEQERAFHRGEGK